MKELGASHKSEKWLALLLTLVFMGAILMMPQSAANQSLIRALQIEVEQQGAGLVFMFSARDKNGTTIPVQVHIVYVYTKQPDTNEESMLWQIESKDSRVGIERCVYGVLPEGFKQVIPARGRPESLKQDRRYYVSCVGTSPEGGQGLAEFVFH